jgi:hypothetical protein
MSTTSDDHNTPEDKFDHELLLSCWSAKDPTRLMKWKNEENKRLSNRTPREHSTEEETAQTLLISHRANEED